MKRRQHCSCNLCGKETTCPANWPEEQVKSWVTCWECSGLGPKPKHEHLDRKSLTAHETKALLEWDVIRDRDRNDTLDDNEYRDTV